MWGFPLWPLSVQVNISWAAHIVPLCWRNTEVDGQIVHLQSTMAATIAYLCTLRPCGRVLFLLKCCNVCCYRQTGERGHVLCLSRLYPSVLCCSWYVNITFCHQMWQLTGSWSVSTNKYSVINNNNSWWSYGVHQLTGLYSVITAHDDVVINYVNWFCCHKGNTWSVSVNMGVFCWGHEVC